MKIQISHIIFGSLTLSNTTEEQIREIKEATKRPVVPDEDCPELTPRQYAEMKEIARSRKYDDKNDSRYSSKST